MVEQAAEIWLVRHGETTWSRDGLHTSTTDLPLTDRGAEQARGVGARLTGHAFSLVLTSPRTRARHTAALAGFPDAVVDENLTEWDYGRYEGISTAEIRQAVPTWSLWTHATPEGEAATDVGARADRVLDRARAAAGDVLVFGHGHALRVLGARWLRLPPTDGRLFDLDTGTVSILGYELGSPVLRVWNG